MIDFKNKLVFVSMPFSHPDKEVKEKRFKLGCIGCGKIMLEGGYSLSPVVQGLPIANEMSLPDDFDYWKNYCIALLSKCEIMVVLAIDGYKESAGIKGEVEIAENLGIPIYLYSTDLEYIREITKTDPL